MILRCLLISDTHLFHEDSGISEVVLPPADMLIHSGDASFEGTPEEMHRFWEWFGKLPYKHKVFVAGNHDTIFEKNPVLARSQIPPGVTYLQDSMTEIEGLRIWGSPWQPAFLNWAFNLERGYPLRQKWDKMPEKVDIVVTHCPPMGINDKLEDGESVGCADLRNAVFQRDPILHTYGHIHQSGGKARRLGKTLFVNAAILNMGMSYNGRQPFLVDINTETRAADVVVS